MNRDRLSLYHQASLHNPEPRRVLRGIFLIHAMESLQHATLSMRLHQARQVSERLDGILSCLRVLRGAAWSTDLYGLFVQLSAERGWPIVGARRFSTYLDLLETGRKVIRDMRRVESGGMRMRVILVR